MSTSLAHTPRSVSDIGATIDANVEVLATACDLFARIGREAYAEPVPGLAKSGIGAHLRHCLDVYDRFLAGVAAGRVDYTARARDERTAADPACGIARVRATLVALDAARSWPAATPLLVRAEGALGGDDPSAWGPSSVGREAQFLLSHTTHHFAIVAMLLRARGIDPGETFGVAHSTLASERVARS